MVTTLTWRSQAQLLKNLYLPILRRLIVWNHTKALAQLRLVRRRIPPIMPSSAELAAYLRVAAYTMALFDYLQTLPAEFRLYAKQKGPFNLSIPCILFILVRYLGVLTICSGVVGFFYHGFSVEACSHFFWVTPVFKLFLYLSSQAILTLRQVSTYAVSRKSKVVLRLLIVLSIVTGNDCLDILETRSCTSGNAPTPGFRVAAVYYASCLLFDVVTMVISAGYLLRFSTSNLSINTLTTMMIRDGIIYFVVLTAFNIVNVIFFQSGDTALQSAATAPGYAVTMIFSSRFILNLSERTRPDGYSGENLSRTPITISGPGVRRGAKRDSVGITVTKSVITMHDVATSHSSESRAVKSEWQAEMV
ncbi:hypothetical protein B0H16DRAFT_1799804 [Mycena metata]|uniref:DUF6533 domain-containing protein n=1 Tax=Mycena metata TaxID=1033252 RepID=A0AAD7NKI5_9AGAR|nr:hypothetical protein B0H16DRAFT_1799804 [Mycena metata]